MQTKTNQATMTKTTKQAQSQEQYVQAMLAKYGVDAKLMVFTF
jgi:hypothetical protein